MSSIRDEEELKVYNYSTSSIVLVGQNKHEYYIPGCNDGVPGVEFMTFRDVDYVNSHSPVFRTGAAQFDKEKQEDIYSALRITNWKATAIFENDIDELIVNPTKENIQRILEVPDVFTFERIRGHYIGLKNDPNKDISNRVADAIEKRWEELKLGKSKSEYTVKSNGESTKATEKDAEIEALKSQIQNQNTQMDELKSMLQQILSATSSGAASETVPAPYTVRDVNTEVASESVKSGRGRKKVTTV